MPFIDVTAEDMKRGVLIGPPGWYTVHVEKVGDWEPAKSGTSNNSRVTAKIVRNADSGAVDFAGFDAPNWMFNDKAPGFAVGMIRALGVPITEGRLELKVAEGQTLDVFIKHEEYNGRMTAKVDHQYRATR